LSYARIFNFVQPAHLTCFLLTAQMPNTSVNKAQRAPELTDALSDYYLISQVFSHVHQGLGLE